MGLTLLATTWLSRVDRVSLLGCRDETETGPCSELLKERRRRLNVPSLVPLTEEWQRGEGLCYANSRVQVDV